MTEGKHRGGGLLRSDPMIKSTSEEDFSARQSTASSSSAGPGYFSDRPSTCSNTPMSADSSPINMSPWHGADLFPSGTGLVASLVREEGHIYSLAASRDLLYTGSDSKNIRVWKNHRDFSGFKSSSGLIKAIVISGDHAVFTGHQDGKIRVWRVSPKDPRLHKRVATLPRLKELLKSSMKPSNYVDSRHRRKRSALWIRHSDAISSLCIDESHGLLYSASWDRTFKVWRLADSRCLESVHAHDDTVNSLVVAPMDAVVFTGSADGTVKMWRREVAAALVTGKKKKAATQHELAETVLRQDSAVTALAVGSDAGVLYAGSSDGVVNFWEREGDGRVAHGGELRGHRQAVLCVVAAGAMVFSGSADATICVWRRDGPGTHVCLSVLTGHGGPVKCLAVVADGEEERSRDGARMWVVYSGSLDKSVKVWRVAEQLMEGRMQPGGLPRGNGLDEADFDGAPVFDTY